MSAPLVSVIVPAHDAGSTVVDTLESVRRQTVTDLEVIVIDDGSTDDTVARVARVTDPRITLASFPGAGPSTARNRGMARARGAYLSFLDADDLWTPDKLELQLEALRRRADAGVAYSWTREIDPAGRPLGPQAPVRHEGDVYAPMLLGFFLGTGSNALLRRAVIETVGEFDSGLQGVEDWEYFLRAAARWPFVVVPRYQILYRQSPRSLSSRIDVMREQSLRVVERAFASAPAHLQGLKPRTLRQRPSLSGPHGAHAGGGRRECRARATEPGRSAAPRSAAPPEPHHAAPLRPMGARAVRLHARGRANRRGVAAGSIPT